MKHTSHSRAVRFLSSLLYFFSIFIFTTAFDLAHNPPLGWENQFLPDLNGRIISDMCFTDSLNGYATAYKKFDPNYILRTTNGGINWIVSDSLVSWLTKVQFLDMKIGYVCGARMYKTTNAGNNWSQINLPGEAGAIDMSVINEDTIWITDDEGLTGGIFLTTNGGGSWTRKYYSGGSANPNKIYFANTKLGFASKSVLLRTSDGGDTWINYNPEIGFDDIYFPDTNLGYKTSNGKILKTINGGINWHILPTPEKNDTLSYNSVIRISSLLPNNSMYAVGAEAFIGSIRRKGVIFKSTDAGDTWGYQLPDTNIIKFRKYSFTDFEDDSTGWAYQINIGGIFTRIGGDTTIYTGIRNISSEIPEKFMLYQNYPNPFNPVTKIRFDVKLRSKVHLKLFDISGKEMKTLVEDEFSPGSYEYTLDASELSSGTYFVKMHSEKQSQTIKLVLIR